MRPLGGGSRGAGGLGAPACLGFMGRFPSRSPSAARRGQRAGGARFVPPATSSAASSAVSSPGAALQLAGDLARAHALNDGQAAALARVAQMLAAGAPPVTLVQGKTRRRPAELRRQPGVPSRVLAPGVRGASQSHRDLHRHPPEVELALKAGTEGHGRRKPLSSKERCPPLPSVPALLLVLSAASLHIRCADPRGPGTCLR